MSFPTWVQKKNRTKGAQASARLRYMLCRLANEFSERATIRSVCELSGAANHSTVSLYISKGSFSEACAARFEEFFGAEHITAAALVAPLEVEPAYVDRKHGKK